MSGRTRLSSRGYSIRPLHVATRIRPARAWRLDVIHLIAGAGPTPLASAGAVVLPLEGQYCGG